jgi:hypothetical protein
MDAEQYMACYGGGVFLLIKLVGDSGQLEQALSMSSTLLEPRQRPLSSPPTATAVPISQVNTDTNIASQSEAVVPQNLCLEPYFVVAIEKRNPAASFLEEVTVGRARRNDIVLRHPSVSKLHATFHLDRLGAIGLEDAGSKNGCTINGERFKGRIDISSGDTLCLGSVETVVCDAYSLWRAARV